MTEVFCDYCGNPFSTRGIRLHKLHCKDRPKTTEVHEKNGIVQHQEERPLNPSTSVVDTKIKASTSVEVLPENIISTEKYAETEIVQNQEESPLNPSTSEVQTDVQKDDSQGDDGAWVAGGLLGLGLLGGLIAWMRGR
jgi:hypothetical protein